MKKIILSVLFLAIFAPITIAANFTNNYPLPGSSICSARLQVDTAATLAQVADAYTRNSCGSYQITNTQVSRNYERYKEPSTGITWGLWAENWTVKTCKGNFTANIGFKNDVYGKTGTDFYILNAQEIINSAR